MQEAEETRPRTMGSKMAFAAVLLALAGVASAYAGVVAPMIGFVLYALAVLISLVGTFMGVIARLRGRGTSAAALAPLAVAAALIAPAFSSRDVPRINDISTDTENPPSFVAAKEHGPNSGRDMAYPGADFAAQQSAAYPDLVTKRVDTGVEETLVRLRAVIADLPDSTLVAFSAGEGRIEATQTSGLFKFVDDIVVRVKADGTGSIVDIRSKSRDGQSDLGVNAARIRKLLAALDS